MYMTFHDHIHLSTNFIILIYTPFCYSISIIISLLSSYLSQSDVTYERKYTLQMCVRLAYLT